MNQRKEYVVDLLLITVVAIWGLNYAVMKVMYHYFHPIAFNALRFTIASIAMVLIIKARGQRLRIDRADRPGILWLGFLANTLYQFCYVLGLNRDNGGKRGAVDGIEPCFCIPDRRGDPP